MCGLAGRYERVHLAGGGRRSKYLVQCYLDGLN
jgi:hypothetical protein